MRAINTILAFILFAFPAYGQTVDLPEKYEVLSVKSVKWLAAGRGMGRLLERLEYNKPVRPFMSDGCSSVAPDVIEGVDIYHCCCEHDLKYYPKGTQTDKAIADLELALCMLNKGVSPFTAKVYLDNVWLWGNNPFEPWGFGAGGRK